LVVEVEVGELQVQRLVVLQLLEQGRLEIMQDLF
jgi:hypothetical protein